MSTRAVIVWLVIAIVLGIAAVLLLRTSGPAKTPIGMVPVGEKLFAFAPSQVRAITVTRADGSREVVERPTPPVATTEPAFGADAEWQLRILPAKPDAYAPPPWPLIPSRVQGLLRILSETRAAAEPAADASLGPQPTEVRFDLADGTSTTLRLAERTLAGSALVEISPAAAAGGSPPTTPTTRRALIDDTLHVAFNNPGPREWRERAVLASIAPDASRVQFENSRQTVGLGKVGGRWSLREPVPAPANPAAIKRLTGLLSDIVITDFLDTGAGSANTGLESPTARLTVEADHRSLGTGDAAAEPAVTTQSVTLTLGGAADVAGSRLFASINDSRLVLLDARSLAALTLDPAPYILPYPTATAPADIGTIVLDHDDPTATGKAFRRSLTRWSQILPNGTEIALADTDLRDVDALVAFLTGPTNLAGNSAKAGVPDPAAPLITISPPDGLRTVGKISVLSLAGAPLDSIEVGLTPAAAAVLRTGRVYRVYQPVRLPRLLADMLTTTPVPAAASGEPAAVEMTK